MPDDLVRLQRGHFESGDGRPSLETLERIKKEIIDTSKEASDKVQFGADVTVEDAQEVRDREDEVVEIIQKLKQRVETGVAGPAQLRAIQKWLQENQLKEGIDLRTGSELAEQVQDRTF